MFPNLSYFGQPVALHEVISARHPDNSEQFSLLCNSLLPVLEPVLFFLVHRGRKPDVSIPQRKPSCARTALGCVYLRFLRRVRDLDGAVSL